MIKVVAAVIKRDLHYFIARRAVHKDHAGKWEFPGGKIESDETPEQALERELLEEFSVKTRTGCYLMSGQFDYGDKKIELMAYRSTYISGDFTLTDHDKIAWVGLHELNQFDMNKADLPIIDFLIENDKA